MVSGRKKPVEGRRERRRRETRTALSRAAMHLIRERGIYGARIEDITERADVAKGVFYNYFASKEALVAELVSDGVVLLDEKYLAHAGGTPGLAGRIEALVRAHEAFFADHPGYALLFHQARGMLELDGRDAAVLRRAFVGYLGRVAECLRTLAGARAPAADGLFDAAAAVAGAAAGYRSFCIAAGRPIHAAIIGGTVAGGVPRLLRARGTPGAGARNARKKKARKRRT